MKKLFLLFFLPCLLLLSLLSPQSASAADVRGGDEIIITENTPNLKDLYLFGGQIRVDAPVTNDIVAAGGNITISQAVTNSLIVAGGDINLNGQTGNTVRAAGGNIRINGPVANDLVVAGGSIFVSKEASIGGDVLSAGGNLVLEGPVRGKVMLEGGNVTINSAVNGDVNAEVGKLTLGPNARINGNLNYKSENKAQIASGAVVNGKTNYTQVTHQKEAEKARQVITAGAIYKLIADILLSLLFIYFFARALTAIIRRIMTKPVESGAAGFAFILLFPVAAALLLILLWLGIAAFLSYALILLISTFVVKVFLGWLIMHWWENRNKKAYVLDWKAGVIGPFILFLLNLIPVIGWLASALLFFVAVGAVLIELINLMRGQKLLPQRAAVKKRK